MQNPESENHGGQSPRLLIVDDKVENLIGLEKILADGKNELHQFKPEIMASMRKLAAEVIEEEAAKDALSTKVNESFKAFKKRIGAWGQFSEAAYHQLIAERIETG